MGHVARLRPIRVLLVGRDRRYLRAANAMLRQSACETRSTEKVSAVPSLRARWSPDVVVLDASGAVALTMRLAAAVEAGEPKAAVVVVADKPSAARVRALPKWESLKQLPEMVERGYSTSRSFGDEIAAG